MHEIGLNNTIFGRTALTGYIIHTITMYNYLRESSYVPDDMALCGRNV
jgi:hypothetical protein